MPFAAMHCRRKMHEKETLILILNPYIALAMRIMMNTLQKMVFVRTLDRYFGSLLSLCLEALFKWKSIVSKNGVN